MLLGVRCSSEALRPPLGLRALWYLDCNIAGCAPLDVCPALRRGDHCRLRWFYWYFATFMTVQAAVIASRAFCSSCSISSS